MRDTIFGRVCVQFFSIIPSCHVTSRWVLAKLTWQIYGSRLWSQSPLKSGGAFTVTQNNQTSGRGHKFCLVKFLDTLLTSHCFQHGWKLKHSPRNEKEHHLWTIHLSLAWVQHIQNVLSLLLGISAQKGLFLVFFGHKFHTWLEAQAVFFRLPFIAPRASCHDPLKVSCFGVCCPLNNSLQNGSLHNLKKTAQNAAEKRDCFFLTSSFHSRSWNITATGLRALSCLAFFDKSCNGIIDLVLDFVFWWGLFTLCMLFLHFSGCVFCCCGAFLANVCCWFLFALVQIAGCTLHEETNSKSTWTNGIPKRKGSSSNFQPSIFKTKLLVSGRIYWFSLAIGAFRFRFVYI